MQHHGPQPPASPPVISWFDEFDGDNPYGFLSNFFRGHDLFYGNVAYPTGEHLYQALKSDNDADRRAIAALPGPNEAKARGQSIKLRSDWELIKYDVMVTVLDTKFTLRRPEGLWLLNTGDALLVEGTWWNDRVWGVDLGDQAHRLPWQRPGRNWLGRLLMARRAELRAEQMYGMAADPGSEIMAFVTDNPVRRAALAAARKPPPAHRPAGQRTFTHDVPEPDGRSWSELALTTTDRDMPPWWELEGPTVADLGQPDGIGTWLDDVAQADACTHEAWEDRKGGARWCADCHQYLGLTSRLRKRAARRRGKK